MKDISVLLFYVLHSFPSIEFTFPVLNLSDFQMFLKSTVVCNQKKFKYYLVNFKSDCI